MSRPEPPGAPTWNTASNNHPRQWGCCVLAPLFLVLAPANLADGFRVPPEALSRPFCVTLWRSFRDGAGFFPAPIYPPKGGWCGNTPLSAIAPAVNPSVIFMLE